MDWFVYYCGMQLWTYSSLGQSDVGRTDLNMVHLISSRANLSIASAARLGGRGADWQSPRDKRVGAVAAAEFMI